MYCLSGILGTAETTFYANEILAACQECPKQFRPLQPRLFLWSQHRNSFRNSCMKTNHANVLPSRTSMSLGKLKRPHFLFADQPLIRFPVFGAMHLQIMFSMPKKKKCLDRYLQFRKCLTTRSPGVPEWTRASRYTKQRIRYTIVGNVSIASRTNVVYYSNFKCSIVKRVTSTNGLHQFSLFSFFKSILQSLQYAVSSSPTNNVFLSL